MDQVDTKPAETHGSAGPDTRAADPRSWNLEGDRVYWAEWSTYFTVSVRRVMTMAQSRTPRRATESPQERLLQIGR